jgi:hypothetical protein
MFKLINVIVILLIGLLAREIFSLHVLCCFSGISSLASPVGVRNPTELNGGCLRPLITQAWDVRMTDYIGQSPYDFSDEHLSATCYRNEPLFPMVINCAFYDTDDFCWELIHQPDRWLSPFGCHLFEFKNEQSNSKNVFGPK